MKKPLEVFQMMEVKGICVELARFYEFWAAYVENSGNMHRANEIYHRGMVSAKDSTQFLSEAFE